MIQINVHLPVDKPFETRIVFAKILPESKVPVVDFQIDDVSIYFRSLEQIDQVMTALAEARGKMVEILPPAEEPQPQPVAGILDRAEEII